MNLKTFFIITQMSIMSLVGSLNAQMMNNLTIQGKVNNTTSPYIYLSHLSSTGLVNIDTSDVDSDGTFSIYADIDGAGYYQLHLGQKQYAIMVLQPDETIDIELDGNNLIDIVKVSGSPETEMVNRVLDGMNIYAQKQDSLNTEYGKLMNTPDKAEKGEVLIAEYNRLEEAKSTYLSKQVAASPGLAALLFLEQLEIDKYLKLYEQVDKELYPKYKDIQFVAELHKKVEAKLKLAVGRPAPDFQLPDTNDVMVNLSDFKGKVVLIDFWASWCQPCRKESPNMVKYYEKYHDMGFEILSVSLDKKRSDWMKGIHDDGLEWTHVSDLRGWKSSAGKLYGVGSIPFTVLVDEKGNIIATGLRGAALEQKLDEIFMQ